MKYIILIQVSRHGIGRIEQYPSEQKKLSVILLVIHLMKTFFYDEVRWKYLIILSQYNTPMMALDGNKNMPVEYRDRKEIWRHRGVRRLNSIPYLIYQYYFSHFFN